MSVENEATMVQSLDPCLLLVWIPISDVSWHTKNLTIPSACPLLSSQLWQIPHSVTLKINDPPINILDENLVIKGYSYLEYRLRNSENKLALPQPHTNYLKRRFSYRGSMLWNRQPFFWTPIYSFFINCVITALDKTWHSWKAALVIS